MGGPVAPDTIHYLHNQGGLIPKSVPVDGNIFWGGDIDIVRSLIKSGRINPSQIRFFPDFDTTLAPILQFSCDTIDCVFLLVVFG
jgi:hypothetical protein